LFTSVQGYSHETFDFVVDATVPVQPTEDWFNSDTLEHVKAISNSQIYFDCGGAEASTFGATTSGFVMLFDENGLRQFAGGVTSSRGHEGENTGCDSLQRLLCHEIERAESVPTFGCRLCLPDDTHAPKSSCTIGAT
jgi:hypothetical protein